MIKNTSVCSQGPFGPPGAEGSKGSRGPRGPRVCKTDASCFLPPPFIIFLKNAFLIVCPLLCYFK